MNIYFDSPEHCDVPPGTLPVDDSRHPEYGTTQMSLSSNTRITSATGTPAKVAIYFVGSQSRLTNLLMSSNTQIAGSCVQNFIIYAPLTHIELNSNSQYCGALAGQSLHMDSNAQLFTDADSQAFVLPGHRPPLCGQPVRRVHGRELVAPEQRLLSRGAVMRGRALTITAEERGFTLPELLVATVLGSARDRGGCDRFHERDPEPTPGQLSGCGDPAGSHDDGADHTGASSGLERAQRVELPALDRHLRPQRHLRGRRIQQLDQLPGHLFLLAPGPAVAPRRARTEPAPGPAVQVVNGLSSTNVFSYTPPTPTAPAYVGVTLAFPAKGGSDAINLTDGAALRNPGSGS